MIDNKDIHLDEQRILSILKPQQRKIKLILIFQIFCFLACLLCVFAIFIFKNGYFFFGIPICFVLLFSLLFFEKSIEKKYKNDYSQLIAKPVLNAYFEQAEYQPLMGFTLNDFLATNIMSWNNYYRIKSEDLIIGKYAGIDFKQSDIRITHAQKTKNGRRTVEVINGRLTQFQYKKSMRGRLLIAPNLHLGNANIIPLKNESLSKVKTENVAFNNIFSVYSNDPHGVFYLLTPKFMEYLIALSKLDKYIFISYDGKALNILRSGKGGIFEPSIKNFNLNTEVAKSKRELDEIPKIIKLLRLADTPDQANIQKESANNTQETSDGFQDLEISAYEVPDNSNNSKKGIIGGCGCLAYLIFLVLIIVVFILIYINAA